MRSYLADLPEEEWWSRVIAEAKRPFPHFNYPNFYSWVVKEHPTYRRFVEVGCWKGASTSYLAQQIKQNCPEGELYAVDLWSLTADMEKLWKDIAQRIELPFGTEGCFLYDLYNINLILAGVRSVVRDIREDSTVAAQYFADRTLDFVFLDPCHTYPKVKRDLLAWRSKLRPGGLFAGHDYGGTHVGVAQAVDEVLGKPNLGEGSVWWLYL